MNRFVSIVLTILFFISLPGLSEGFELVVKDELRFRLVPESTLNDIVKDLKSSDNLKLELSSLQNINEANEGIIIGQKRIISDLELKNEVWSKEVKIREGYTNQLEIIYDFEIKENERLRLDRPNVVIWGIGGFTVGTLLIFLSSMVLKNSK